MIQYDSKNWLMGIFSARTAMFKLLLNNIILITIYSALVVYVNLDLFKVDFNLTMTVHSLLGIVLGLLLVFRTNTAYERWWEGRKLLGTMVNSTRNWALKLNAILPLQDTENRRWFADMIPNYCFAMKEHLRNGVKFEELKGLNTTMEHNLRKRRHVPNHIAGYLYERTYKLHKEGIIGMEQFLTLNSHLENLTDTVGACERIKKTPIPYSYSVHLKQFIFVYLLTFPFAIMHELKYFTVIASAILFYAFVGLELMGEEIEDPFGTDANDLPTDEICKVIRHNIHEILHV